MNVAVCIVFFLLSNIPPTDTNLFIHLTVGERVCHLQFLLITNKLLWSLVYKYFSFLLGEYSGVE